MNTLNLYKIDKKQSGKRRHARIAAEMRECFSSVILRGDLLEIPNSIITITHIDLSPDLRNAKVFFISLKGEKQIETLEYLNSHIHFFKNVIATKMKMRFIPEIIFKIDDSFEYSKKIEELFTKNNINKSV